MAATVPRRLLVAAQPFGGRLQAGRVAELICAGLGAGGRESEPCALPAAPDHRAAEGLLAGIAFDARMRESRALVIACASLSRATLAGSLPFELATRARQAGVPAYAVARESTLDAFDARILDLQEVLLARGPQGLRAAGRRLAALA